MTTTTTIDITPDHMSGEARFHAVPWLGTTAYGDPTELLGASNAAAALAALEAVGVEAFIAPRRTWACAVDVFVVDAYHPAALPTLTALWERLESYPVLDEDDFSRREWEAGYCLACGEFGMPECYGEGVTCESCGQTS